MRCGGQPSQYGRGDGGRQDRPTQPERETVGALERGDHYPSLDLALRICDVFGLPVEAVFSRTEFTPLSAELYRRNFRSEGSDS